MPFTAASYLRTVSFILFKDKFMLNRRVVDLEGCRNKGQEFEAELAKQDPLCRYNSFEIISAEEDF